MKAVYMGPFKHLSASWLCSGVNPTGLGPPATPRRARLQDNHLSTMALSAAELHDIKHRGERVRTNALDLEQTNS